MTRTKAILVMLALGLVRLLRPLITIRFGTLFVSRLGHLSGNTECYLCSPKPARTWDIWCPQGKPANEQLFKMYSRVMTVSDFGTILNKVGGRWEWWKKHHQFTDANWGRDIHNLMEKSPPHIAFTPEEERRGQVEMAAFGCPPGAKFVCIIARDPFYLRVTEPWNNYSYHDFRNSDIQNYRLAAKELVERGYFVFRMGRHAAEPMRLRSEAFIDYAFHPAQSDFLDVYLGAKCAFTISNGAGFDGIPMVFRRPICFVNESPFEYLSTWMPNSLAIWKHHEKDGKRMSVAEIVASGAGLFSQSAQFEQAGIKLIENTPEEIRDAALEMVQWPDQTPEQREFWKRYPRNASPATGQPLHGEVRLRIGREFLRAY